VLMMIRIIPNFLHDGSNLHSPPMPLFLNLHREGGHMDKWVAQLMRALQSAQADKTPLDPILRFLGTNQESVDISVTLLGLDRTQQLVENEMHNKYKDYFKNVEEWRIGGRISKTYFAIDHTLNTEFVKLYEHEFIPTKLFMSFPQNLDKRISNGCLLLSIVACYIQTMIVNIQKYQSNTCKKGLKNKKTKGIPWEAIYKRWCELAYLARPSCRTQARGVRSKITAIIDDVIFIILHAVEQLPYLEQAEMHEDLRAFTSPSEIRKLLKGPTTVRELTPLIVVLGLRVHFIGRHEGFSKKSYNTS